MPAPKRRRVEPIDDWQQLQLLTDWPEQLAYELIRPVVLFGEAIVRRAEETATSESTIRRTVTRFDATGMAGLFPSPREDDETTSNGRRLPHELQQLIVDLKAEHPPFRVNELATICYAVSGRRPSPHTVKRVLASGLPASRTTRRYPPYTQIADPVERRRAILHLHSEGWNIKSIAVYLETTRRRVYETVRRVIEEASEDGTTAVGDEALQDRSHRPKTISRKVDLRAIRAVRKLQENPELGEFRIHAALKNEGIELSPRTCGRILALNRSLYGLHRPPPEPREPKPMRFKATRPHQYWTVDVRYIDVHQLGGGNIYVISILENYSRCILASLLSRTQDLAAFLIVLYAAIRRYGAPEALVSDGGGIFKATRALAIYQALGITKEKIKPRQAWESYIEPNFNVQRRMADWHFARATSWEEMLAVHDRWLEDFNTQSHWAHRKRKDGRRSPAEVLAWFMGRQYTAEELHRIFYTTRSMRQLDHLGYVRFRHWRLYGNRGLPGMPAVVWLCGDLLTLEGEETPLTQYLVTYAPNHIRLQTVSPLRQFETPFHSPQLPLWNLQPHEWQLARSLPPYAPRRQQDNGAVQGRLAL